jgi:hypothetical protein
MSGKGIVLAVAVALLCLLLFLLPIIVHHLLN